MVNSPEAIAAAQAGAARALGVLLRRLRPDLTWEVGVPGDGSQLRSSEPRPGEVLRLMAGCDHPHALGDVDSAALPDPGDAHRAA